MSLPKNSSDVGPGRGWHYGADVTAVNAAIDADSGSQVMRAIRVGDISGGANLFLVRSEGDDPAGKQVSATAVAGELWIQDFWRVGTDSDCGDFTVYE